MTPKLTYSSAYDIQAGMLGDDPDNSHPICEAILGPAGSGKSTEIRARSADDPSYCKLVATTGIAAINLGPGVSTINSVLGYFNEESAFDVLESGRLQSRFRGLADAGYKKLVIDEISMMSAGTLTAITLACAMAADDVHQMNDKRTRQVNPVGIILCGDFLQLPPVNAPFCFNSPVWPRYERGVTKLEKIYRQTNPEFLEALQSARGGRGTSAVMKLGGCGVKFVSERNDFFDGTSLVPTNDMANKINATRYATIAGEERIYKSARWGKESGEWKDIPIDLGLKVGAFVMVLANMPRTFEYVNGDQGEIVEMGEHFATVNIHRGEQRSLQQIPFVWRETTQKAQPDNAEPWEGSGGFRVPDEIKAAFNGDKVLQARTFASFFADYDAYTAQAIKLHRPYFSVDKERWVVGWIEYLPIRLAYASTLHKAQGLTLDAVQIDARSRFAGNPGSMYVALSRCRTPENIRIVASPQDFARRIQTALECMRWV